MKIILRRVFVILPFALTLLSVYFAYLEYTLFRTQVVRQDDPLIQYSFVEDKNAFVVSGGSDIEIKEVEWTMPSVAENVSIRINKHPRILTLQDVITQLYYDSTYLFAGLSPIDREYFIRCRVLEDTYSSGIPLIAKVTFRQRGAKHLSQVSSLVYAEWLTNDNPFIEVYEENASEEQSANFITRALGELRKRFTIARAMTIVRDAVTLNGLSRDTSEKTGIACPQKAGENIS